MLLLNSNTSIMTSADADTGLTLQEKLNHIYDSTEKVAYLTFDDGPTKVATPAILDILKENDVKATFFVIGSRVEEFPEIVARTYNEGHLIANHTYSHRNSKIYVDKDSFIQELSHANDVISTAIGVPDYNSHIFRFPNGSKSNVYFHQKLKCISYLEELGYGYIDWNALNNDSVKNYSSSQLLENLKKSTKNKNSLVVLMHDTNDVSKSYLALDDSIKYLKEQGYTFKTFSDL